MSDQNKNYVKRSKLLGDIVIFILVIGQWVGVRSHENTRHDYKQPLDTIINVDTSTMTHRHLDQGIKVRQFQCELHFFLCTLIIRLHLFVC